MVVNIIKSRLLFHKLKLLLSLLIISLLSGGIILSTNKYNKNDKYKTHTLMNTIELKFNEKLFNTLKSRIKFVGTGSDIVVTENNIQVMAKCLMF